MKSTSYKLPQRACRIFLALSRVLAVDPPEVVINQRNQWVIQKIQIVLAELPALSRWLFIMGVYFFDRATFLFGFGVRRFVNASQTTQESYVTYWRSSHSMLKREIFKGMRSLIILAYFSHQDIWNYLNYNPRSHVDERVKMRQDLLHNTEQQSS